jgi:hypothetical protein
MKTRFFENYEITSMCAKSLRLRNKRTGDIVMIHRNAFNKIVNEIAEDYREHRVEWSDHSDLWVEVLVWRTI